MRAFLNYSDSFYSAAFLYRIYGTVFVISKLGYAYAAVEEAAAGKLVGMIEEI